MSGNIKKKRVFSLWRYRLFFGGEGGLGFVFHCRHVVCDTVNVIWKFQPKHEIGVQISVMSVFTLFDCPLNFLLD